MEAKCGNEIVASDRCSGVIISYSFIMTAAHCLIFPSKKYESCIGKNKFVNKW